MNYLFCIIIGYLVGSVNPAYLLARKRGFDIRERGSGNAGASNAVILFGKLRGFLCAAFDIAKACFAIWLTRKLYPNFALAYALTGSACILGHIFPFCMKFRGGKGLACLAGTVLMFDWRVFLGLLAIEIVIALVTDYICFVPITASVAFPVVYAAMTRDIIGMLILAVATVMILYKHVENLHRIRNGTEAHLSYLWKPQAELERLRHNQDNENS